MYDNIPSRVKEMTTTITNEGNNMAKQFKENQELSARSICDYNCIFTATVIKRTAKTVTIKIRGDQKRCKIQSDNDGNEFIFPLGRYSMAPTFKA